MLFIQGLHGKRSLKLGFVDTYVVVNKRHMICIESFIRSSFKRSPEQKGVAQELQHQQQSFTLEHQMICFTCANLIWHDSSTLAVI